MRPVSILLVLMACGLALPLRASASRATRDTLSLAGSWRFQLDRQDAGQSNRWWALKLGERIHLPGALQNQGFGDDITIDTAWIGNVGIERWKGEPQYEKYRQPGHIQVPFFLQPQKHYVGVAWYQRDFNVPATWQGQRVVLTLERPHWETRVWVDGKPMGTNDSLSTAHVYDLGISLEPGNHTLTIRVDNRLVVDVGPMAHSVTDHTQGDWNGIIGNIALSATSPVWIESLQAYPEVAARAVKVRGRLGNATGKPGRGAIRIDVSRLAARGDSAFEVHLNHPLEVAWDVAGGTFETTLNLGEKAPLWDEFQPALLRLVATLECEPAVHADRSGGDVRTECARISTKSVVFGLREIGTQDRQFILNGQPIFFRGTLECCVFPRTGYPPTDVESWRRIICVCKAYGLNHIRFHSWCPPEAAFVAADELGFYYQVECGVFGRVGDGKPIDQWIYRESERIVEDYGNHPSFLLFTHGNEPHGSRREEYLAKWVNYWKARDPRRLVTTGTAFPILSESQFHVYHGARGPADWFGRDYGTNFAALTAPVIVHELGQWCVYPRFDEIKKYTGPLKAKNFEIFRDSLAEHGMLDQWPDFVRASGRLQVLCYKEEIEAALGTLGIGGLQLLDLHDFPGQGTALVGVLDPFWDSKGYVTPEELRRFCGPTVPLAHLPKRTWTTAEMLTADVRVIHYGARPLGNAVVAWQLAAEGGNVVARGEFTPGTLPLGQGGVLGRIQADLGKLEAPKAYNLMVRVISAANGRMDSARGSDPQNNWNIWVYPARAEIDTSTNILVTSALDNAALERLGAGGTVVLFPEHLSGEHPKLYFEPVFWNRYMFNKRRPQTLGLLIASKHPALSQFPTDFFQDWQWNEIVTQSHGLVLDGLPKKLRPIVQPIDDWNSNRRLGLIFECRVGPGRLLVCSADLQADLENRPAARQLRRSLLDYAASAAFKPSVQVSQDQLVLLFGNTNKL